MHPLVEYSRYCVKEHEEHEEGCSRETCRVTCSRSQNKEILHRLQSKCQRGNECKERSSVFKRRAKSNLQNRVPKLMPTDFSIEIPVYVLHEHQAVYKLLDDHPFTVKRVGLL